MKAKANCTPKMTERANAQRERILCAAQACFVDQGFHAASMSSIAEAAAMSPGLIYRYFENKNAIILAIIDRQLEEKRNDIATLQSGRELSERIHALFETWRTGGEDAMNAPLFLEMTAEASRDPTVAHAVESADSLSRVDLVKWFQRAAGENGTTLSDDEARWRAFSLQVFVEGLVIRSIREPDIDQRLLTESLKALLPVWLGPTAS